MRILQLISSLGYSDVENFLVQLSGELDKNKFCEVTSGVINNLATPHVEVADASSAKGIKSVIFPCRGKFDLQTLAQIRHFCRDKKINILHSHGYKADLYSFIATRCLPVARVATCHELLDTDLKMRYYNFIDHLLLRNFSYIVTASRKSQKIFSEWKIFPGKLALIRNEISPNRFGKNKISDLLKPTLGIPKKNKVIGTVWRMAPEKEHIHFLNTAAAFEKKHRDITFLIVGDGKLSNEMQGNLNGNNLIFTGSQSTLPELYDCMDIFVLPTQTKDLPLELLEAMASGLPIVASHIGSIPKLVKNDETGYIIEPTNGRNMQDKILHLLKEPKTRKARGKRARSKIRNEFSLAMMALEYLCIYQQILPKEN